jgi:hypothetical protein
MRPTLSSSSNNDLTSGSFLKSDHLVDRVAQNTLIRGTIAIRSVSASARG